MGAGALDQNRACRMSNWISNLIMRIVIRTSDQPFDRTSKLSRCLLKTLLSLSDISGQKSRRMSQRRLAN